MKNENMVQLKCRCQNCGNEWFANVQDEDEASIYSPKNCDKCGSVYTEVIGESGATI